MGRKKLNELEWFINLPDLYDGATIYFQSKKQKEALEIILKLRDQRRNEETRNLKLLEKSYYKKYHSKEDVSELIQDFKVGYAEFIPAIEQLNELIDIIPEKAWVEIQNKIKKKRMASKGVTVTIDKELLCDIAVKLELKLSTHNKISSKEVRLILETVKSRLGVDSN